MGFLPSHSLAVIWVSKPTAFTRISSRPVPRSLHVLVYSIGGAVDTGGVGGGSYRLSAFSNTDARAGVGGSPRVFLIKVFVLLRPSKGYRYSLLSLLQVR